MVKIAVIYPHDSFPTLVTYIFAQRAINLIKMKLPDAQIDTFPILSANRFMWTISKAFNGGYDFVIYAGHGVSDALIGQASILGFIPLGLIWPMQDTNLNPKVKILYAVACLTGRKLGPELVMKRVRSYIGNIDYTYVAYPKNEHNYMEDFIDTWLEFIRGLLAGDTVKLAFARFQGKMRYYMDLYSRHFRDWPHARFYYHALARNLDGFRLFGNAYEKLL